jgi:hypothetical protein
VNSKYYKAYLVHTAAFVIRLLAVQTGSILIFVFIFYIRCYTVLLRCRGVHFSLDLTKSVWLAGRVIGPSQDLYLNTGQHKHTPNIHDLSGIRTHDHGLRASEDSSCLRTLGYRNGRIYSWQVQLFFSLRARLRNLPSNGKVGLFPQW